MKTLYNGLIFICILLCIFLNPAAAQNMSSEATKTLIKVNNKTLNFSNNDLAEMQITSNGTTNKLTYVYAQQYYKDIKVYNAIVSFCFDMQGTMLSNNNRFVNKIESKAPSQNPAITATDAVINAAAALSLSKPTSLKIIPSILNTSSVTTFTPAGIAKQNILAQLIWISTDDGKTIKLAWNITIDVLYSADYWYINVDAINGKIINSANATLYENNIDQSKINKKKSAALQIIKKQISPIQINKNNQPSIVPDANYNVLPLPIEAPSFGSLTILNDPWLAAGGSNPVTIFGWQSTGAAQFMYTNGNNTKAYDDKANLNAPGHFDTSSTALPSLNFIKVPDFTVNPSVTNNIRAATTNLFYVTNSMHDITYQYGFDEVSGNFQVNNNGRGGIGNDAVNAESQDGSGIDNANMATLPDGQSPRMQMYLWNSPNSSLTVNSPASIAGNDVSVPSAFSTNNTLTTPITSNVIIANPNNGCTAITNTAATAGNIVLINRGGCAFTVKVKNAQNAGAIAVIMVDNVVEAPFGMGGTDNTITIPAVMISNADGNNISSTITGGSPVNVTLNLPPPMLDGDYDNGIIAHEFTHGISNRLTGGPAITTCLQNAEQAGEGWSDYIALMVTQNWATTTLADSLINRSIGTYVIGEPTTGGGIRTFPYTLNMSVDPHTYADLNGTVAGSEVHYIGEVWASVLWDMTWRIIEQEGTIEPNMYNAVSNGGNAVAMNDVITGMKLQPCSPGYLDARDAILKADSILYNFRHKCAIWGAFARRGMGYSALQGSSNSTSDQTVAFNLPAAVTFAKSTISDSLNANDTLTYTLSANCSCTLPTNYKIIDTLSANLTFINSTAGSASGNIVTINPINFTQQNQILSYTIKTMPTIAGCNITTSINDNREASTAGGFTTAGGWAVSAVRSASPTSSWFATEPATASNITLTSTAFALTKSSLFSFHHYFNTETTYDGGVVEISVDNGSTWQDLGSKIIKNPYNTTMDASTTLAGQKAFSGSTYGAFIYTTIDLTSYNGQTVMLRFRFTSDVGNSVVVEGWYIDDIKLSTGCSIKNTATLYTGTSAAIGSGSAFTFIIPPTVLPVTLTNFTANKVGNQPQVKLIWNVVGEININNYTVQRSTDAINWTTINITNANGYTTYSTNDNNPLVNNINYYRLKIYSTDGSFTYSDIRFVNFNGTQNSLFTLYPNPAGNYTDVVFTNNIIPNTNIDIYNANGKLIAAETIHANVRINTSSFAAGIYYVKGTTTNGIVITKKLIISR